MSFRINDPLNLVAHKLGPAIAGGNAVILKPSELAPLSALRLVGLMVEAGLPEDIVTVAVGGAALGSAIVGEKSIRLISFTGGFATAEKIARTAGLKRLSMDLGGNAAVIVMADSDLEAAVDACVSGAFWAAGQNCIGTQRILVERTVFGRFRDAFVARTRRLRVGDPGDVKTDVGPMITPAAARAASRAIDAAVAGGARLLCGNVVDRGLLHPTVLENVSPDDAMCRDECFAPIVLLQPVDDLDVAIEWANAPEYALHAAIFTTDLGRAMHAAARLQAGGVIINDSSDYRCDAMPFGGFKYGSMGREGIRFAYEDMTQTKVICLNL